MFDDKTLNERDGDAALLALLREWQTMKARAEEEFKGRDSEEDDEAVGIAISEAMDRFEAMADIPAEGVTGLAAKIVALGIFAQAYEVSEHPVHVSAIADAIRLCPELASFVDADAARRFPEIKSLVAELESEAGSCSTAIRSSALFSS